MRTIDNEQKDIRNFRTLDFDKIRLGNQTLKDPIATIGAFKTIRKNYVRKADILRAIDNYDLPLMRQASDFFYKSSGIYNRIIRYMAFMYRYDWYITPIMDDPSAVNQTKMLKGFYAALKVLDDFGVKKILGDIAVKVLKDGAYYGYRVKKDGVWTIQELPINYCRSRFTQKNKPVVEFNMSYFDDTFTTPAMREKILKIFPPEFRKGYIMYKKGKLPPQFMGDKNGWYILDTRYTIRFTSNGEEFPAFISVIPLIIDLDEAQDVDRQKSLQELGKVIIQHIPHNTDGTLVFEPEEAQQFHQNAVGMLNKMIGVDVLTTYADVEIEELVGSNAASGRSDDLERVERSVYNEAGVSQKQFNTNGNLALEKSILNDAATMYNLVLQFEAFLNELLEDVNRPLKKVQMRAQILTTTIYNYQELTKLYKEQTQLGYSKMLPQVALGQSQSSILSTAYFENEVLDLANLFIPPMSSNVMNAEALQGFRGQEKQNKENAAAAQQQNKAAGQNEENKGGRPEKANDEKSEKTIANRESM